MTRASALVLIATLMLGSQGCSKATPDPSDAGPARPATATFLTESNEITVALRVADDPDEIKRGLMHVKALPPYEGMIFIFASAGVQRFWMKNTLIHLDMIFVDDNMRIVGIVEDAEPLTMNARSVALPSRYVIEVNGGFTKKHAIRAGDRVSLDGVPR